MTIDSGFFKIIKRECASAFVSDLPMTMKPDTVFIDGQIKLMKADAVRTWSSFLHLQYYKTIEQSFGFGASTVVLAFDNYEFVPVSKGMTQANRSKSMPRIDVCASDDLPSTLPENWSVLMRNRTFKVKVINYILRCVQNWFEAKYEASLASHDAVWGNRTLVLDFAETIVLGKSIENPITAEMNVGRGECDIKAFNWLKSCERMLVYSTDGDYLPIALLQIQKFALSNADTRNYLPDVWLFRIETKVASNTTSKRKRVDGSFQSKFQKEFVHVNAIYSWIQDVFPSTKTTAVNQLCCLIAMCGCDFAMNLPQLGPQRLWQIRHLLRHVDLTDKDSVVLAISVAYQHSFSQKNPRLMTERDCTPEGSIQHLNFTLQKISRASNKRLASQIWSTERICAHACNVLWVIQYWNLLQAHIHPHNEPGAWGYVVDAKGRTQFAAV